MDPIASCNLLALVRAYPGRPVSSLKGPREHWPRRALMGAGAFFSRRRGGVAGHAHTVGGMAENRPPTYGGAEALSVVLQGDAP